TASGRMTTLATTIATTIRAAPTPNASWAPPVRAAARLARLSARSVPRAVASEAIAARPNAPPTWRVVFTSPDARPASLGVAPDIARLGSDGKGRPRAVPGADDRRTTAG